MYTFEHVTTDQPGLGRVLALLKYVWGEKHVFNTDYLRWLYRDNPAGEVVGFNAVHEGQVVAHYVTIPIQVEIDGGVQRGLLSLNTVTHPAHQGKKLFTRLAEQTYRHGAEQGHGFVIGVSNRNSTPGMTKSLGFDLVCQLEARLGVPPPRFRSQEPATSVRFRRMWDDASLAWRLQPPGRPYQASRCARTGGHFILARSGYPGIKAAIGYLPGDIAVAAVEALPRSAPALWAWIGLDPKINWRRSAFLPIPDRLRPAPLNLIFRSLRADVPRLKADEIKLQGIDFDAYLGRGQ